MNLDHSKGIQSPMDWNSCVREEFDWIPERFLSALNREKLLTCFISDHQIPVRFLQIHPVTGVADIVCPTAEALNASKLKIRWFIANYAFFISRYGDGI